MADLLKTITPPVLIGFLVCTMLSTGLKLSLLDALGPLSDWQFVALTLALNFVLAPGLAWLLTIIIPLEKGHAIGLILLGAAAGAPFLPNLASMAGRQPSLAVASMLLLTAGTIVFMPLMLPQMIPGLKTEPWDIIRPLLLFIVLPLAVGLLTRIFALRFSEAAGPVLAKVGNVCLVLLCVLLVARNAKGILNLAGSGAVASSILHMSLLIAAGWLMARSRPEIRDVLSLGAGARNFGAALAAATNLDNPAVAVMITVSAIAALLILFPLARWMAKTPPAPQPTQT